jgi:[ribosomal protein S18]-alanine N-acetyltransferase
VSNPSPKSVRLTRHYNGGVPFTVRDFRSSDFETIWRIDQTCFPPGISYSRAELRFYIQRRNAFTLVATSNEDLVAKGAIAGFIVAEAGPRARGHIITIDVVAAARRSGTGSLLLRAAEDRLLSLKCETVRLETSVDNVTALSFYKRHGYSVVRTAPRYYSNGMDALVLEKGLA